jgi:hypothetical protein
VRSEGEGETAEEAEGEPTEEAEAATEIVEAAEEARGTEEAGTSIEDTADVAGGSGCRMEPSGGNGSALSEDKAREAEADAFAGEQNLPGGPDSVADAAARFLRCFLLFLDGFFELPVGAGS